MLKSIAVFILLIISNFSFSQASRSETPIGFNLNIGGSSGLLGGSLDAFVSPSINIEVGIGHAIVSPSVFGGVKYHSDGVSDENFSLYTGIIVVVVSEMYKPSRIHTRSTGIPLLYVPIGFHSISDNGFTFGFELAGAYDKSGDFFKHHFFGWAGIKIGFHFGFKDNLPKPAKQKSTYRDENYEYHRD